MRDLVNTLNNAQFRASFAGAFMSVVRSSNPNIHPPVPDVITPHWDTFNIDHTQMLFNKTESDQPVITPISTDEGLLQRCEWVLKAFILHWTSFLNFRIGFGGVWRNLYPSDRSAIFYRRWVPNCMLILPWGVCHSADLFPICHPLFLPGNNSSREADKTARCEPSADCSGDPH